MNDLDFIDHLIQVRRAYVDRRFGPPKSKASKAPVPMHPLLAAHRLAWRKETLYPGDEDFVFPSLRLKGKKPPAANMLVADYLRVAARRRLESSRHRVLSVFTPSEERWPRCW